MQGAEPFLGRSTCSDLYTLTREVSSEHTLFAQACCMMLSADALKKIRYQKIMDQNYGPEKLHIKIQRSSDHPSPAGNAPDVSKPS
jgi:hypothetical protein